MRGMRRARARGGSRFGEMVRRASKRWLWSWTCVFLVHSVDLGASSSLFFIGITMERVTGY